MRCTTLASLLLPIVCATGCARAGAVLVADAARSPRAITLGDGIAVPSGPALTALPMNQRYRFVPPDALATGLAADDIASADEPHVVELRQALAATLAGAHWEEGADSAAFDVTIFTTSRLTTRRESRERLVANAPAPVARCDQWPSPPTQCTDDPVVYTEVVSTEHHTVHIIRRRSDGAVRVWRIAGRAQAALGARVRSEVIAMLRGIDE